MKKYTVYGTAHMACVLDVEVGSEQEAIDIANEANPTEWELTTSSPESPVEAETASLADGGQKVSKKKLSLEDRKLLSDEEMRAEKFIIERVKFKGPVRFIDDGKTDVIFSLPYQKMVKLLRDYGIARIAEFYEGSLRSEETPCPEKS